MATTEVAAGATELPEKEPTEVIKPEEAPKPFLAEDPDMGDDDEGLSYEKYEEKPESFFDDTDDGTTDEQHEEVKPTTGWVDGNEDEDEIESEEFDD